MTWDKTQPLATDLISSGDDEIREFKTDIEDALQSEGIFPGTDTANPVFKWKGKRGATASRPVVLDTDELYFNTELTRLEYWSGAAWVGYDLVPLLGITEGKIAALAVTNGKLGALAVTNAKVNDVDWTKITRTTLPKFKAMASNQTFVTGDGTSYEVQFVNEEYDEASEWDGTSKHTISQTGVYHYDGCLQIILVAASCNQIILSVKGNTGNTLHSFRDARVSGNFNDYVMYTIPFSFDVHMTAAQWVKVYLQCSGGSKDVGILGGTGISWFSGHFIG